MCTCLSGVLEAINATDFWGFLALNCSLLFSVCTWQSVPHNIERITLACLEILKAGTLLPISMPMHKGFVTQLLMPGGIEISCHGNDSLPLSRQRRCHADHVTQHTLWRAVSYAVSVIYWQCHAHVMPSAVFINEVTWWRRAITS